MANLIDQKLSSTDFSGKNIQALPTKPTITAEQLKERFDYAAEQVVAPKHNALVDILADTTAGVSGSEQIGSAPISGVAGDTVHEQMADLKYQFDNVLLDPRVFPDGSVTTARLMDEAVTLEKIDPDALAWNNISSKPAAFTPSAHSHAAGDLPSASTTAPGVVQLDSLVNSTSEVRAATSLAVKMVNDKVGALERFRDFITAELVSGNNFVAVDTSVTSYPNGLRRTLMFSSASDSPQVNINGVGYRPVLISPGIPMKVKAYQPVEVMAFDAYFFAVSAGRLSLPSTLTAGEYPVKVFTDTVTLVGTTGTVTPGVVMRTINIKKSGMYRFKWNVIGCGTSYNSYADLLRNGAQMDSVGVSGTTFQNSKTVDYALTANDVIALRLRTHSVTSSTSTGNSLFGIYTAIPDLDVEMTEIGN